MKLHHLLISVSALAVPLPALAQSADEGDTAAQQGLGDIIVTANRVASSAQDTATALNVYSGDALRDQGIASVRDLTAIDPSVNMATSTGSAYVAVRGIASTDVTEIGDPSVPVARDGFFTNRSFSLASSMYDLDRIEVLKGPQGTLQGRNSTGGLISIITKRPSFENGGYASLEVGNYGTFNSELGANLALTDTLAVRASGTFQSHDGYRRSDGVMRRLDDENFASGRIQALYQSGGLSALVSYQHDSRTVDGDAQFTRPLETAIDVDNIGKASSNVPQSTSVTLDRIRWELSYAADMGLNFMYQGGYDTAEWNNVLDATGVAYPFASRQFRQNEKPKTWNHELRISNEKTNGLFVQAGFFYFSEDNTIDSGVFDYDMYAPFAGTPFDFSRTYGIKFDYDVKTRSKAVFGQLEYDLTDTLTASLGGRYTWDKKVREGGSVLNLAALAFPMLSSVPFSVDGSGNMKESKPTWHGGLEYKPTPDTMIYGKYDRGYKPGGFNSNGSAASIPYGSETVDAFELGTKNSLLGNTLQINADIFYTNYRGYQASQTADALDGSAGTFNVGSAKIYGAEGSINALVAEHTRLGVNGTYLHTKFGQNIEVNDGGGVAQQIGGNQLPNAPKFVVTGSVDQDFMMPAGKVTAHVDVKYSSSYYFSVFNNADTRSPAYAMANATLGYASDNGWKLTAFVKNIFDKNVLSYAARNFNSDLNTYQFQPPRTFGVRGSVDF
ncbi:TonB-dependent receptor [Novosphingobium profundi]|uniref:TonB-dependent receptor n=1 Tax=Novosphingobium profundi TaxID=1774954 RepID=UPI001BD97946|nr:TonB-dependent receptor [Novosphingobium profundi]